MVTVTGLARQDVPFKRTVCKFWLQGRCEKGEQCTWAHGKAEVSVPSVPGPLDPVDYDPLEQMEYDPLEQIEIGEGQPPYDDDEDAADFSEGGREDETELDNIEGPLEPKRIPDALRPAMRSICKFWEEGKCKNGERCSFAHGQEEIGKPIPADAILTGAPFAGFAPPRRRTSSPFDAFVPMVGASLVSAPFVFQPATPVKHLTEKRSICKFWQQGKCQRGIECTFAHGSRELGTPISGPRGASLVMQVPICPPKGKGKGKGCALALPAEAPKRTLCKFWQEGRCEKGELCTWAHGIEEVGTMPGVRQPEAELLNDFKSPDTLRRTICKFWLQNRCSKAPGQCTFAHGDQEIGTHAPLDEAVSLPVGSPILALAPAPQCKFFAEGICKKGSSCPFAHVSAGPLKRSFSQGSFEVFKKRRLM